MSSTWCYDSGEASMLYNTAARHNNAVHPTAHSAALIRET